MNSTKFRENNFSTTFVLEFETLCEYRWEYKIQIKKEISK